MFMDLGRLDLHLLAIPSQQLSFQNALLLHLTASQSESEAVFKGAM
jgi:hypothetical protein